MHGIHVPLSKVIQARGDHDDIFVDSAQQVVFV